MTSASPRANRPRFAEMVLADLIDRIASGEFAPGASLPAEPVLLAEYGVSRGVAREAVKLLESRGIARTQHGLGTTVAPYDDWNLLDPLILSACTRYDTELRIQNELATLRSSLESELAALAAASASPADIRELDGYLESMRCTLDDPDQFVGFDFLFHGAIMRMTPSLLIRQLVRTVHTHIRVEEDISAVPADELRTSFNEHVAIRDAIAAGDPDLARETMEQHIADAWGRRREALQPRAPDSRSAALPR